jgi:aspartate aminotransferase-like enzyme
VKACEDLSLFTPGPVNVPPRVLAAGARPFLHHRTAEAAVIIDRLVQQAKALFETQQDVLLVHTTGRGAMEGAIQNLLSPGDEILCVCNGKFGEMFAEIAERNGLITHRVGTDWLKPLRLDEVEAALATRPQIKAITVCHNETTTACLNDIKGIAAIAKRHGILSIVDAVSSAGCAPIRFDAWQIDALVTASQKGLMSPPGLSFVVLSDAAWKAVDAANNSRFYIQFRDIQKNLNGKRAETPGTTPMSLVANVDEALSMILAEGSEECYARHELVGQAIRAGLTAMGLKLFPEEAEQRSPALTAFRVAPEVSVALKKSLRETFGIVVASGLGKEYKDNVIRIGHMGHVYAKDALTIVAAVEASLFEAGVITAIGAGTSACARAIVAKS